MTLQEHQCRVHVAPYIYHGPLNLRIWEEKDPKTQQVVAIKNYVSTYEQTRTIWMDGRPHPSAYAPHTFMGFSTGKWDGQVLTVVTTHLKQGWLRRNGVPESDQTTLFERFSRHGHYLTHTVIITDPVYLAEPMIRTTDFQLSERDVANWLWPCEYVEEISGRAKGEVPHYLPGANPFLEDYAKKTGTPMAGMHGGAETIYPEYQAKLKQPGLGASNTAAARTSQARNPDRGTIELLPVQGNVYLLAGAGGNSVLQVGESGAILVDTKSGPLTEQVLAEIRKLVPAGKTLRIIMNTSADADHVGGNQKIAETLGSSAAWTIINTPGGSNAAVKIVAHDNVLPRVSDLKNTAWPTETFIEADKEFFFNGEPVSMRHVPAAHTDGDSIVVLPQVGRGGDRRHLPHRQLPGDRPGTRRQRAGRAQRPEPGARHRDSRAPRRGRDDDRARPWAHRRRVRPGRVPRHGDHRPGPRPGPDQEGDDARAGEGRAADARLRLPLRRRQRRLDHGPVRRGRLQESERA